MKSGRFWLTILSIAIAVSSATTIFAVIGPPVVIHSITGQDWVTCFDTYVKEYSRIKRLEISWVRWGFNYSLAISIVALLAGVALGFKARWAQITLVILGGISLSTVVVSNIWNFPSTELSSLFRTTESILFWAATVVFLLQPSCRSFLGLGPLKPIKPKQAGAEVKE